MEGISRSKLPLKRLWFTYRG